VAEAAQTGEEEFLRGQKDCFRSLKISPGILANLRNIILPGNAWNPPFSPKRLLLSVRARHRAEGDENLACGVEGVLLLN